MSAMTKTWWKRIEKAEARGCFTEYDIEAARDWVTCACGEQDPRIPRWPGYEVPKDPYLKRFGELFYEAVQRGTPDEARGILAKIERRATEVLAALPPEAK